ncbi:MAG: hypothetical protein HQK66_15460 [Desulfamplus sp.]|nr:hypothetical protein [Desulfamplus sp.]
MANPKTHDALAKWLIASFIREFFGHYFPNRKIGRYGLDHYFGQQRRGEPVCSPFTRAD